MFDAWNSRCGNWIGAVTKMKNLNEDFNCEELLKSLVSQASIRSFTKLIKWPLRDRIEQKWGRVLNESYLGKYKEKYQLP